MFVAISDNSRCCSYAYATTLMSRAVIITVCRLRLPFDAAAVTLLFDE